MPGASTRCWQGLRAPANAGAALDAYNPPHAGYRALKEKLAELRASHPSQPSVRVPLGPALRVGMRDPRVPLIRARFNLARGCGRDRLRRARRLRGRGVPAGEGPAANGVLNAQTVAALSGPSSAQLEGDLIANMERWRWLPPDLGARHIAVNIPEFRLRLVEGRQRGPSDPGDRRQGARRRRRSSPTK